MSIKNKHFKKSRQNRCDYIRKKLLANQMKEKLNAAFVLSYMQVGHMDNDMMRQFNIILTSHIGWNRKMT